MSRFFATFFCSCGVLSDYAPDIYEPLCAHLFCEFGPDLGRLKAALPRALAATTATKAIASADVKKWGSGLAPTPHNAVQAVVFGVRVRVRGRVSATTVRRIM